MCRRLVKNTDESEHWYYFWCVQSLICYLILNSIFHWVKSYRTDFVPLVVEWSRKGEQNTALYNGDDTQILHCEKPWNKMLAPKLKLIFYTISDKNQEQTNK